MSFTPVKPGHPDYEAVLARARKLHTEVCVCEAGAINSENPWNSGYFELAQLRFYSERISSEGQ